MAQIILDKLKQKFGHAILSTHNQCGNETAVVMKDDLVAMCEYLKKDPVLDMSMVVDVTCVDWPERELKSPDGELFDARFDVVIHLYSIDKHHRVRLKVPVGGEPPRCPSITPIWAGANWFEREAYDMYGVVFEGHPDLRRILLYPEFIGYPLRKDYPIDKRQPLIENRLKNVNYGTTGVTGDTVFQGSPLVQIGRRSHHE